MCLLVHVPIKRNFFFFFFFDVVVLHWTSQGTASKMYQVYNVRAKALCYVLFRDVVVCLNVFVIHVYSIFVNSFSV